MIALKIFYSNIHFILTFVDDILQLKAITRFAFRQILQTVFGRTKIDGIKMKLNSLFFMVLMYIFVRHSSANDDEFHEELFIKPLQTGHVNTYFQFTTEWRLKNNESCKFYALLILYEKFSKHSAEK